MFFLSTLFSEEKSRGAELTAKLVNNVTNEATGDEYNSHNSLFHIL